MMAVETDLQALNSSLHDATELIYQLPSKSTSTCSTAPTLSVSAHVVPNSEDR